MIGGIVLIICSPRPGHEKKGGPVFPEHGADSGMLNTGREAFTGGTILEYRYFSFHLFRRSFRTTTQKWGGKKAVLFRFMNPNRLNGQVLVRISQSVRSDFPIN